MSASSERIERGGRVSRVSGVGGVSRVSRLSGVSPVSRVSESSERRGRTEPEGVPKGLLGSSKDLQGGERGTRNEHRFEWVSRARPGRPGEE